MKISKKLEEFLKKSKIKHEIVSHKTTYTAFDLAATTAKLKTKPAEIVKVLVVKGDTKHFLALLPSTKILDLMKLKKLVNSELEKAEKKTLKEFPAKAGKSKPIKKVELAKEAWMKKNLPGKIGAVSPFSEITGLKIYFDKSLEKQKMIYLGTGEYQLAIKMKPRDYLKIEKNAVKGNFAKTRK